MFRAQVGWQGDIVAFSYWEMWSVPIKEDEFFSKFGCGKGNGAVIVC